MERISRGFVTSPGKDEDADNGEGERESPPFTAPSLTLDDEPHSSDILNDCIEESLENDTQVNKYQLHLKSTGLHKHRSRLLGLH